MTLENLETVVSATCYLLNFLKDDCKVLFVETCENEEESSDGALEDLPGVGGFSIADAKSVRGKFKDYFYSSAGSIPWQKDIVLRRRRG